MDASATPEDELERLRARVRELEARQAQLRSLLDNVPIGLFSMEDAPSGVMTLVNPALARLFGCASVADAVGRQASEFYPDQKERPETFARFLADPGFRATGVAKFETVRRRLDDGALLPILITVCASFDANGRIGRFDGAMEDVTERKRAERTFLASEERFRIMFETAVVGVVLTDAEGRISRVNGAFCAFVRRDERALLGVPLDALLVLSEGEPGLVARALARGATASSVAEEHRFQVEAGAEAWGYGALTWITDADGRPAQGALVVQDVSARKRFEEQLLRVQKLESLAVLAGGVAHDFNNFLAAILGNLSLARHRGGAQADECLREAEDAALRARDLTRQLLEFGRGGAPVKRPLQLVALAREVMRFCLRGSSVTGDVVEVAGVPLVEADPGQLEQVLSNLVINARDAMPGGGHLEVRLEPVEIEPDAGLPIAPGSYVRIAVRDEGVGIAAEHLERVFDPYFTTKAQGSGLGLATVFSIVGRHLGHVGVRSERGRGTTFTVHLPARLEAAPPPDRTPDAPRSPRCGRVLVMDDEEQLRRVLRAIRMEHGFEVDAVEEGSEALRRWEAARAEERPYAFAILDVTIRGGLGGEETMRRLRALDPSAKVIVSSGYAAGSLLARHKEHGFAGVVEKPYSIDELMRAVDAVLAAT